MTLTLVSSDDGPALIIRDHLLPLVREYGTLEIQRDTIRLIALRTEAWAIEHWIPFNELSRGEASSPSYRHALERQHTMPDLPYGLDIWHAGTKVLSGNCSSTPFLMRSTGQFAAEIDPPRLK